MRLEDVEKIAAATRLRFESGTIDKSRLKQLYAEYAEVGDVGEFVDRAQDLFPKLNCGLASLALKDALGSGAVTNGRFLDENHTFLLLGRDTIADITADQYGGPSVYVGPLKNPWRLGNSQSF